MLNQRLPEIQFPHADNNKLHQKTFLDVCKWGYGKVVDVEGHYGSKSQSMKINSKIHICEEEVKHRAAFEM